MAFTSGTAADYLDLLNRLKQFVTQDMLPANERWSVLRWVPGPPAELVLQGPGLAGTDQINVGILSEAGADYGNWKLRGFVGWNAAQTFDGQYNPSGTFYALLMASAMPYWIVANGRRIVMVAKTGTYYEMLHLGLFLPYATPGQYPYTVRFYNENNALQKTLTGLTTTAWTYLTADEATDSGLGRINGKFKVEIESVRAGYTSWQKQTRSVDRAGYGLNYGKYYGGI